MSEWLRAAVLVAVLLVSQTAALVHSETEDAHPAGEVCTWCVGLATLGAGNVGTPPPFDLVTRREQPLEDARLAHAGRRIEARFARGPPPAS